MKLSPNKRRRPARLHGKSSGFTMVECVVAIMVINLTIAGMFQLLKSQESQVRQAEKWLSNDPVLFINQDADPLARALGKPATLDPTLQQEFWQPESLPFEIVLLTYDMDISPIRLRVVFEQFLIEEKKEEGPKEKEKGEDDKDKEKGKGDEERDKKKKVRR